MKKEKIINLVIIHLAAIATIFLVWYFIYSHNVLEKHFSYCREYCKPGIMVENLSRKNCFCYYADAKEEVEE